MTVPLRCSSDAQLAAAVEENLFALFRAIAALPGGELVEGDTLSYHRTFPPAPMFNAVWRSQLAPHQVDAAIDQTLDWFQARGAALVSWWFNQQTQPPALFERLQARGFELDYRAPGMVFDIDTLTEAPRLPDGFTIVEAVTPSALADWTAALLGAYAEYGMPVSSARVWEDATLALGGSAAPWRLYVGYWNGQPVATNLLFNGAGVAGLYCVGTIPEARGKGMGAAITLKPLIDAKAEGYRYGVLFASEMGAPMYRKIGFRAVDIEIGRYVWYRD